MNTQHEYTAATKPNQNLFRINFNNMLKMCCTDSFLNLKSHTSLPTCNLKVECICILNDTARFNKYNQTSRTPSGCQTHNPVYALAGTSGDWQGIANIARAPLNHDDHDMICTFDCCSPEEA